MRASHHSLGGISTWPGGACKLARLSPVAPGLLTVVLSLLTTAAAANPAAAIDPSSRPNILLVTLDTTRADRFAAWGGQQGITPAADRLAARAVVFERAVASAPTTSPSHASMLSGLETARHGVHTNASVLPATIRTVPELLREAGYTTAAFASNRVLLVASGLSRGFDVASAPSHPSGIRLGSATARLAVEWMRSAGRDGQPFFAWVHFFDAHSPYALTPRARERLRDYHGPIRGTVSVNDFGLGSWIDDPEDTRAVVERYDGLVQQADRALALVLRTLEKSGLAERTVVIVTADHGQALGEHRRPGHGALWDSILHVPLLIADGSRPAQPKRVRERVGLVDLAPTILELAGTQPPEGLDGRSLAPALRGEALETRAYVSRRRETTLPNRTPLAQAVIDQRDARLNTPTQSTAVYYDDWKIVEGSTGRLVFDLGRDSKENEPVRPGSPGEDDQVSSTIRRLEGLLREAKNTGNASPETNPVPDDTLEALRALGYVE